MQSASKKNPPRNALAMHACKALIDAITTGDASGQRAPFLKRRMAMLSAINKACMAIGVQFENHPETIAELLGTFGAEMSFFNADQHEEQERHHHGPEDRMSAD